MESREIWERLEKQLQIHAPDLAAKLRPSLNESTLIECEERLRLRLPEDVRFAYLRHDGCTGSPSWLDLTLLGQFQWCSLQGMVDDWRDICEPFEGYTTDSVCYFDESDPRWETAPIRPFSQLIPDKWIPIGVGDGSTIYIDLIPGLAGTTGQIIGQFFHAGQLNVWLIAPSLNAYLQDLSVALESGAAKVLVHPDTQRQYWGNPATKEEFRAKGYAEVY